MSQTRPHSALRVGRWKFLHFYEDNRDELYDLAADPSEQRDLSTADPTRVIGQVITGIGFLGAGVMLTRDGMVVGATSAASATAIKSTSSDWWSGRPSSNPCAKIGDTAAINPIAHQ